MDTRLLVGRRPASAAVPAHVFRAASRWLGEAVLIAEASSPAYPVRFVSAAFERMTGWPPEEVLGRHLLFTHAGAADPEVAARAQRALEEGSPFEGMLLLARKDGSALAAALRLIPVPDTRGRVAHIVAIQQDITAQRVAEERLQYLLNHDSLTRLATRASFTAALDEFVQQAAAAGGGGVLLYCDLDNFKLVNDTLGHLAGDFVLTQFAGILRERVPPPGLAARLGGDEFVVLLRSGDVAAAAALAEAVRQEFQQCRVEGDEQNYDLCLSIGLAAFDPQLTAEEWLSQADLACCAAKHHGRDRIEIYRASDAEIVRLRDSGRWGHRLKEALRHEQFELWYQPIVALPGGRPEFFEALIRLRDTADEVVPPGQFMPAAERFQLAGAIDRLALKLAVRALGAQPGLRLSLNLSSQSFDDEGLAGYIEEAFAAGGVEPGRVIFEITETAMLSNLRQAREALRRLKRCGLRFALDDFGRGFSSLAHLRELPVDFVKIDGTFVSGLRADPINEILVRSIKETARLLGLRTVAEFVEDAETLELLTYIGVDYAQGNFFGPARPAPFEVAGR
jgi:diguanylate cyclase (GGDEF)-like protein/PAS domain S-box-containing protein